MADEINPDALPENPDEAAGTANMKQLLGVDSPVLDDSPDEEIEDTPDEKIETQDSKVSEDIEIVKKRHGDAVRWAQNEAQKRRTLEARINKWKDSGIDPDEIDRLISVDTPTQSGPDQQNFASKEDLKNMASGLQWNMARRDFIDVNPDFKDKDMGVVLDYSVAQVVQEEMRNNNGILISPHNEILTQAAKRARAFTAKFVEQGKKAVTEKRKKISDTAITEGKDKKKVLDEEEEKPYDSKADYIKMRTEKRFV